MLSGLMVRTIHHQNYRRLSKSLTCEEIMKIPGKYLETPPPPHFCLEGIFQGQGRGGGCIFEAPRGRNFIRRPSFLRPPPLEGYFQGWGGCIKLGPVKMADTDLDPQGRN